MMINQKFHSLLAQRLGLAELRPRLAAQTASATPTERGEDSKTKTGPDSILDAKFVDAWTGLVGRIDAAKDEAVIALVGKYTTQVSTVRGMT